LSAKFSKVSGALLPILILSLEVQTILAPCSSETPRTAKNFMMVAVNWFIVGATMHTFDRSIQKDKKKTWKNVGEFLLIL
jgi:hypothetical protein